MNVQRCLPKRALFVVLLMASSTIAAWNPETQSAELSAVNMPTEELLSHEKMIQSSMDTHPGNASLDKFEDNEEDVDLYVDQDDIEFAEILVEGIGPRTHDYILVNKAYTWAQANTYCKRNYESLAILRKKEKDKYFKKDTKSYTGAYLWIGGYSKAGEWVWANANDRPFNPGYVPTWCNSGSSPGANNGECIEWLKSGNCIRPYYNCGYKQPFVCQTPVDEPEEGEGGGNKKKCVKTCKKKFKTCKKKYAKKICKAELTICKNDC